MYTKYEPKKLNEMDEYEKFRLLLYLVNLMPHKNIINVFFSKRR